MPAPRGPLPRRPVKHVPLRPSVAAFALFACSCGLVTDYELPAERCADTVDNDLDGLTDCDDPDCDGVFACENEDCADGRDNDGNGLVDAQDPRCWFENVAGITSLLRVTRCSTVSGVSRTTRPGPGEPWVGRFAYAERGLAALDGSSVVEATYAPTLTGDVQGTRVVVDVSAVEDGSTFEIGLDRGTYEPGVWPGLRATVARSGARWSIELSAGATVGPAEVVAEGVDRATATLFLDREDWRASIDAGGISAQVSLDPPPFSRAVPLRFGWRAEGTGPGAAPVLTRLDVERRPYDPCAGPVPDRVTETFREALAIAASEDRACAAGWTGSDVAVHGGTLPSGALLPSWSDAWVVPGARFVSLAWDPVEARFLMVSSGDPGAGDARLFESDACADWTPVVDVAPPVGAGLLHGVQRRGPAVWLWWRDRDRPLWRACAVDEASGACDVVDARREPDAELGHSIANEDAWPRTLLVPTAGAPLLVARRQDFLAAVTVGAGGRILPASNLPGTFDPIPIQGTFALGPPANGVRAGFLLYTARRCDECTPVAGLATLILGD